MSKIRDEITKVTGFYFSEKTLISQSFLELAKGGRLDKKVLTMIVGVLCDKLEEIEKTKK